MRVLRLKAIAIFNTHTHAHTHTHSIYKRFFFYICIYIYFFFKKRRRKRQQNYSNSSVSSISNGHLDSILYSSKKKGNQVSINLVLYFHRRINRSIYVYICATHSLYVNQIWSPPPMVMDDSHIYYVFDHFDS